ncbi:MAG: M28 family metallopeptidase [Promethearchaeota archaeon]
MYDEQAALNHVKSLGFTRNASTEGETKAINYIRKQLDHEGVETKVESFEWAKTFIRIRHLILLLIFIIFLTSEILILYPSHTWIILPLYGLFFIIFILVGKYLFDHTRNIYIGKRTKSKNIIASIQAKDLYPKRPVIIFSAHYDSTSLNIPYKIRKPILLSTLALLLSSLLINIILSIWSILALFTAIQIDYIYIFIRNMALIIGIILLLEIFIFLFMKQTNESLGSVDNASGVAILIELAKLLKKDPLNKIDVIFLWCGAEEMGLWGSKQYCFKHFEELDNNYDLNKSYNINIDMVGTYVSLIDEVGLFKKKKMNENLNDVLKASDIQHKIPPKKVKLALGTGSDHLVFKVYTKKAEKKGFQVTCFSSKNDSKYIHSKHDIPKLCSVENLNGCIDICYNAIKSLDLRVV